ncbi:caspase family protein [Anabaena catenula]|uniref:Caspase family protein n=1 Tax=Anabaena catenula FACHB-362 TaxID=2692877 RepID=A0ABR8J3F2_9NOST|nr:caspase family protein [Anabaena catenula]MBD2691571.1 caspase family protein [Anabaena catenula FACHB-362]
MPNHNQIKRIAFVTAALTGEELQASQRDAAVVFGILTDPELGSCDPKLSTLIHQCGSQTEFEEAFSLILKSWDSTTQLILYFSGHGKVINNNYCLRFGENVYPFKNLITQLEVNGVGRAILILDTCYSGAAIGTKSNENIFIIEDDIPQGIAIITSSKKSQQSYELENGSHSVFTSLLCQGIKTGLDGKETNSGLISVNDIVTYIHNKLKSPEYSKYAQIPVFEISKADKDVWITKNPNRKTIGKEPKLISPPIRPASPKLIVSPTDQELKLPEGWIEVTQEFIKQKAQNIFPDLIVRYFDVRDPGWEEALSEEIPHRNIVGDLIDTLKRPPERGLRLTVLIGPGCEGKSTALRQAICNLVRSDSSFRIIWWEDPIIADLKTFLMLLPPVGNNERWLIVSDNPSRQLIKAVHELFSEPLPRRDIQFLFCCRDTVWQNYGEELTWDQRRSKISMPKLKEDEARKIVQAWKKAGKLENKSEENAVQELLEKQKSEKAAFLAAMLQICEGTTAKDRVERILIDIKGKPRAKYVLDAYVCIVAMHKEGLDFLKFSVIAEAIQYNPTQIRVDILEELGDEIILHDGKKPIVTRQQVIAEAAYEILSRPPYSKNFEDDIYPRLAKSAQKLVGSGVIGRKGQEIVNWQYDFPNHFANSKPTPRIDLAIQIAEVLYLNSDYQVERDRRLFTHLAGIYLDNYKFPQSIRLFRESSFTTRDRKFYHTWAIAERENGNYLYSVWLCAIALADNTIPILDGESVMIYLSNTGFAFFKLCNKSADAYVKALGASAKLALEIAPRVKYKKDSGDRNKKKTIIDLNENIQRAKRLGVHDLEQITFEQLFQRFKSGLEAVSQSLAKESHENNIMGLPHWVEKLDELQFLSLKQELKQNENGIDL